MLHRKTDAICCEKSKKFRSETELRSFASSLGIDDSIVTKYIKTAEEKIAPAAYMMLSEWLQNSPNIDLDCNKIHQTIKLFKQVSDFT